MAAMSGPRGLRVEHLDDHVLGLGVATPRLSWQLPLGTRRQAAYELEIDGHQQGRVDAPDHLYVPWPTTPVGSATPCAMAGADLDGSG